jgi:hypothetical protein
VPLDEHEPLMLAKLASRWHDYGMTERVPTMIRLTEDRYEWLRGEAFRLRVTQQSVVEDALDLLRQHRTAGDSPAPAPTGRRLAPAEHHARRLFKEPT